MRAVDDDNGRSLEWEMTGSCCPLWVALAKSAGNGSGILDAFQELFSGHVLTV